MTKLKLSDVEGDNPVWDFINAAEKIDSNWSTGMRLQLTLHADQNKDFIMNVPAMIQNLTTFRRSVLVAAGKPASSAFQATFQGEELSDDKLSSEKPPKLSSKNNKRSPQGPDCICGKKHWFNKCCYLNESIRPSDWSPNQDITKKVQKTLDSDPSLQEKIDRSFAKAAEFAAKRKKPVTKASAPELESQYAPKPSESVFTAIFSANHIKTAHATYELKNSFLLDSGATIHICNNLKRFSATHPGSGSILAGDTVVDIKAWGTVDITVNTPRGRETIPLQDVAYIPSFHTSLVSLKKAIGRGFHWNTSTMNLTDGNRVVMTVQLLYDQFVAEFKLLVQPHPTKLLLTSVTN